MLKIYKSHKQNVFRYPLGTRATGLFEKGLFENYLMFEIQSRQSLFIYTLFRARGNFHFKQTLTSQPQLLLVQLFLYK